MGFFFGQVVHRQFLFSQKMCLRKPMAVSLETPCSLSVSLLLARSSGFYTPIPPTPRPHQQQQTIRKIMLSRPPPLQRPGLAKATLFNPTPKQILVKLMSGLYTQYFQTLLKTLKQDGGRGDLNSAPSPATY